MAQLIYEDGSGRRLTLCLSSEPLEVGQAVELVEVGDLTAGYWQDGDLSYALVGETPDDAAGRDRIGTRRRGAQRPPVAAVAAPRRGAHARSGRSTTAEPASETTVAAPMRPRCAGPVEGLARRPSIG